MVAVSLLAGACTGSKHDGGKAARPSLAVEECDHSMHVACQHQEAILTVPVPGTGTSLVYSSERAPGRHDRPSWAQTDLGLGGWSLDVVDRYDTDGNVVLQGDGTWRLATPVAVGGDETAIATYDGRRVFVYDHDGHHVRTVDAVTGTTLLTITYDTAGRLSTVAGAIDDRPVHVEVVRADDGGPRALVGVDGVRTELVLDDAGHLSSVLAQSGRGTFLETTTEGLVTKRLDPAGYGTVFTYDVDGRLDTIDDPDGRKHTFTRTATTSSIEVSERLGEVTSTYRAESTGDGAVRRTYVAIDGTKTAMDTSAAGARQIVVSDGTTTAIGSEPDPRWGAQAPIPTPFVETRPDGATHRIESRRAVTTVADKPLEITTLSEEVADEGGTWTTSYDPTTRTVTLTDPTGRTTIDTVDVAGRVVRHQAPGQPDEARTFDDAGRLASETRGTAVTKFAYDPQTGTRTITRPDGRVELERVDSNGLVVRRTDASGAELGTDYDADGRVTAVRPSHRPPHTVGTSPAGLPTGYLAPPAAGGAATEVRSYDTAGRLATIEGPGDRSVSFTYDAAGHPTGWQSGDDTTSLTYDPATGLVASSVAPGGVNTAYRYSGSTLVGSTWSGPVSGGVTSTLDGAGRTANETVTGTDAVTFGYDAAGALTGVGPLALDRDPTSGLTTQAALGAVTTAYTYDDDGRIASATSTASGAPVLALAYERDALGRVAATTEVRDGVSTRTMYTYDAADQLTAVDAGGTVSQYAYDTNGNRVTVTDAGGSRAAVYDDRDRLVQSGTVTYDYAPDGALAHTVDGDAITTYRHDATGALRSVTLPSAHSVTYVVDAAGQRVGRLVDGALAAGYVYRPDGRVVAELDAKGTVAARFAYDDLDHLAWVVRDGRAYRVVTDRLGSPRLVVDSQSGAVAQSVTYDPWGVVLSDTAPGFQPFGFAGGLLDPDTKLVRFGARDYEPATGRWTSSDPTRFAAGDANLYRYASGDPVNFVDASGADAAPVDEVEETRPSRQTLGGAATGALGLVPAPVGESAGGAATGALGHPSDFSGPVPWRGGSYAVCAFGWCDDRPSEQAGACLGWGCRVEGPSVNEPVICLVGYCSAGPDGFTCIAAICGTPSGWCPSICSVGYGDPHLQSADGTHFDFQAAGEYVIATSSDGSLTIQARQERIDAGADVAYYTALAVNVAGDRVGTYANRAAGLVVNGEPTTEDPLLLRLPHGGLLERHGGIATIEWPDGSHLGFYTGSGAFTFSPSAAIAPTLRGLLGQVNGDPSDDRTGRDGIVLDPVDPDLATKLYTGFGDSWRVTPEESLFDYGPGESTETFALPGVPKPVSAATLAPAQRDAAASLCRALGVNAEPVLSDCVLDLAMTGDVNFAATAAAVAASGHVSGPPETGERAPIAYGDEANGTIEHANEHDRFTFQAHAGDVAYLAGQGACVPGLLWHLLTPTGDASLQAATCDDVGRVPLSAAGTYTIDIFATAGATGAYRIKLTQAPSAVEQSANLGDTVTGEIPAGEWHQVHFDAMAGQVVYLGGDGACVSGLLWRLLTLAGTPVRQAATCDDLGRFTLADSGTYTIEIFANDTTTTGGYQVRLLPAPAPASTATALGQRVAGEITEIGEWHRYSFDATAGQTVTFDSTGTCVSDLFWRLIDPTGSPLSSATSCTDIGPITLPTTGTYVLEIFSDGTAVGPYEFTLH